MTNRLGQIQRAPISGSVWPGIFRAQTGTIRCPGRTQIDYAPRALRRKHGLTCNPMQPHLLHMTLLHVGDRPGLQQSALERPLEIAAGMSARPFDIIFDRAKSLSNPGRKKPFLLIPSKPSSGLLLFQRELLTSMKNAGLIHRRPPAFTPHVTLVWDFASVDDTPLDETITWTVREFQLIFSHVGQSNHECLGSWSLKG